MKFDFETEFERSGHDSLAMDGIEMIVGGKTEEGREIISMWIADMDFATAPSVVEEMEKRLEHPLFGYFMPSDEYLDSIIKWQETRHGVKGIKHEDIGYQNGVLGGLMCALGAFCAPGDKILVHSPTYAGFLMTAENAGYHFVPSQLVEDEAGISRMDFDDMERICAENDIRAALLCSPQNPTGRVWERAELEQFMEFCKKHDLLVISDEIWSDIVLDDHEHIPTQSISEDAKMRTIAFYAPTKTFNLAGLEGSYQIVYNDTIRRRLNKQASLSHYNSLNVMSMHALVGAYSDTGAEWVDELCKVISENSHLVVDFARKNFEGVKVEQPQGTYMVFLDCKEYCEARGETVEDLKNRGIAKGIIWQDGTVFLAPTCLRLNVALPTTKLKRALNTLKEEVFI